MARVTEGILHMKADRSMTKARTKMLENQEKALTGKNINRPSDDPQGTSRVIGLKYQDARKEQVLKNLEVANSYLSLTDSSLAELSDLVVRAKELAVQMSSSSNANPQAQSSVSAEIEQLRLQAVQIGNARVGGHYIFAGFNDDRPPFDADGNYYGDASKFEVEVQSGQRLQINMPGLTPFYGLEELPKEYEMRRNMGETIEGPTLGGELRAPASVQIANRELNPEFEEDKAEIAHLEKKQGVNVFGVLKTFADSLKSGNTQGVQGVLEDLDKAFSQVLTSRANVGALQNALQSNQDLTDADQVNVKTLISSVEDADSTKVFSDLARNETTLQATLEGNKKLLMPSLLDFLK